MSRNGTVYIQDVSPEEAVMDFTPRAAEMISPDKPYGHAFRKTAKYLLDIESEPSRKKGWERLVIRGTANSVYDRLSVLSRHKNMIAGSSAKIAAQAARAAANTKPERVAERAHRTTRVNVINGIEEIEDILEDIPDSYPVSRVCRDIIRPFSKAISSHDEELRIISSPTV